jgi:Domain of unknown function (DUF4209)
MSTQAHRSMEGDMPLLDIALTKDDFDNTRWQDVIASAARKECNTYWGLLSAKARAAEAAGEERVQTVFDLLGGVSSLMLHADRPSDPFGPFFVLDTGPSLILDDLTANHWTALAAIRHDIVDPEMRARVCDCLWVGKRNGRAGHDAIEAYTVSAAALEDIERWPVVADRVERALRLARLLHAADGLTRAVNYVIHLLSKFGDAPSSFFAAKLMALLIEIDRGATVVYTLLAERLAHGAEQQREWRLARTYWERKAAWDALMGRAEQQRAALLVAASTYTSEADEALNREPPDYFVASVHLRDSIQALRNVGNTQEEVEALHLRLVDCQERAMETMSHYRFELPDFTAEANQARQRVAGKPLPAALTSLAFLCASPPLFQLEDLAKHSMQHGVARSIMPMVLVTEKGKVTAERPASASATGANAEQQLRTEMLEQARLMRDLLALAFIESARRQIVEEHLVQLDDMLAVVANSAFVPSNRAKLFARGLLAGIEGDFVVATHLLSPQIENCLRHVLSARGYRVSGLDQYGVQDEMDLNELLPTHVEALEAIFGEDTVFDLRGLLVERFGTNLRNRLAHGLLTYENVQSPRGEYLWWLALRLCVACPSKSDESMGGESTP